jgi:redox-sensing transcriptional repressor
VSSEGKSNGIPAPVVRRLIKYLAHLQHLKAGDGAWVSSQQLAQALNLTAATVRRDFTHIDFAGRTQRGYEIEGLEKTLLHVLGLDAGCNAVIVGVGNLGRALALHQDFQKHGFRICALFDSDPKLVGEKVGHLTVHGMGELADVVRREDVQIGIMAVPAGAAKVVALELISAGVRGLLNLACAHLNVPDDVVIVDARMVESIQELLCLIKMPDRV